MRQLKSLERSGPLDYEAQRETQPSARESSARSARDAASVGVRIELLTVIWMVVEAAVAIGAGVVAHSALLVAFGLDSVLELVTGSALLWRLWTEQRGESLARVERAERVAAWITGIGLALLCVYIVALAALDLVTRSEAATSTVGLALAAVAVVGMPVLAWRKRVIARQLNSVALRGDAACSLSCAYMAGALLVGLALHALLGWWWIESVALVSFLYWLVPEAREALEGARAGRAACSCGDDDCADAPSGENAANGHEKSEKPEKRLA